MNPGRCPLERGTRSLGKLDLQTSGICMSSDLLRVTILLSQTINKPVLCFRERPSFNIKAFCYTNTLQMAIRTKVINDPALLTKNETMHKK